VLVKEFYDFMKYSGPSEKYQNNNLKTIITFGKFLNPSVSFYSINSEHIIKFLDTKIKDISNVGIQHGMIIFQD
jgi:hypothetical protein